jgi:hypothetical protein
MLLNRAHKTFRHLISCSSSNNLSVITTDIFDAKYLSNRYDSAFCNRGVICDNNSEVEILTFHCTLFISQNPQEVLIEDESEAFEYKFTDKRYGISQNRLQR